MSKPEKPQKWEQLSFPFMGIDYGKDPGKHTYVVHNYVTGEIRAVSYRELCDCASGPFRRIQ